MHSASASILVVAAVAVVLICNIIVSFVKKFRQIRQLAAFPSAPSHWLFGHLKHLRKHDGANFQFHIRCATQFQRCYVTWRGPVTGTLVLCHPDTIQVIQSSNAPKGLMYRFVRPFIGDGLICSNGDKWFRMRRLLTPAFHFDILRSYVKVFQDSTNVLLEKLSSQERGEVELFHHMSLMTLDTILKCALGYSSNCQTQEKNNPYIKAVYEACDEIINRFMNPLLHSDVIYQVTPPGRKFAKNCALVQSKAKELIRERRTALQDGVEQEKLRKTKRLDFLDILLEAKDECGNTLTEEEITSEVSTFMFAGHDTTATSISWTLYNLARFPEHQDKCRKEIIEVFGDSEEFEWKDLGKLKHLQLCIKESNRIYPTVPVVLRSLDKPHEIDGIIAPEGTLVASHIFALHRNPHIWESPEKFDPLRFTSEKMKGKSPYAYIPFSAGPR